MQEAVYRTRIPVLGELHLADIRAGYSSAQHLFARGHHRRLSYQEQEVLAQVLKVVLVNGGSSVGECVA